MLYGLQSGLRGLVPRKASSRGSAVGWIHIGATYTAGSHTFVAPADGYYTIYGIGAGGGGRDGTIKYGGGGGGGGIISRRLTAGQEIAITVGSGGTGSTQGLSGGDTVVSGPGFEMIC